MEKRLPYRLLLAALAVGAGASCGPAGVREKGPTNAAAIRHEAATSRCCAGMVYRTRATGYYPEASKLQGGFVDRRGKKLRTLQDFVEGKTDYVSVAMDSTILPYGSDICIPSLNAHYDMSIPFRVVDTGGAFKKKGFSRMDICTASKKDAHAKSVNRSFEFIVCDR